jgi:tetratricopeptide (TPR) repeat protein
MQTRLLHVMITGLLLSCAPQVLAGPDEDFDACDKSTLENVLDVCAIVANDLGQSSENRAVAQTNLSWGYIESGQYEKALESADTSIKLNDKDAVSWNNRGYAKFRLGDLDGAMADYAESIKRDPKYVQPLINRGEVYFKRGEYQKAASDYSLVIKADPKNVDGWNNRGASLQRLKQYDNALADLNQAVRLNPKYVLARANRIEAYYDLGKIDKAAAEADAVVKLFPKDGDAYNIRSWVRKKRGDIDGALVDADEAVTISPEDASFRDTRGAVLLAKGRFADAITDFTKAIELFAEDSSYYRQRAEARLGLADLEGAKADADKALTIKPDDADNLKTMNSVQAAMLGAGTRQATPETPLPQPKKTIAPAGHRVALVIGNGAYPNGMALPNPVNDAKAMAAALARLGFDVVLTTDATKNAMSDAMYTFAVKAEGADAAMVFYAGHGMQVDGVNYLMPVDGSAENQADLKHKFIAADAILDDLKTVKGMRMMVLDACRNNPLSRSIKVKLAKVTSRAVDNRNGLADMKAEGVLIAFATQPNEVAADGDGVNSPFTVALLKHIETPNIEVDTMFKRVRTTASEMTDGVQLPQTVNSSTGEFYLRPE